MCFEVGWSAIRPDGQLQHSKSLRGDAGFKMYASSKFDWCARVSVRAADNLTPHRC